MTADSPEPYTDNEAAAWALLAYPLLKMLTAAPDAAADLVRRLDFAGLDAGLPSIAAPAASAQVLLSAMITALEMLEQRRSAEALRCGLIACRTLMTLCDE